MLTKFDVTLKNSVARTMWRPGCLCLCFRHRPTIAALICNEVMKSVEDFKHLCYISTVRFPDNLHECETWSCNLREENKLMMFENRVLRRGGVVVKALRYKPAGRGFDSQWCHWNF
jgi:hypothetical protein